MHNLKLIFQRENKTNKTQKEKRKQKKYSLRLFCHSQQNTKLIGFPVTKICVYNLVGLS